MTTKQEALEALDVLKGCVTPDHGVLKALVTLRSYIDTPVTEAVAWRARHKTGDFGDLFYTREPYWLRDCGYEVAPLYAAPPHGVAVSGEDIRRAAEAIYNADPMMDQNVDADGIALGQPFAYPWSSIIECFPEVEAHYLKLARAALSQEPSNG